VVAGRAGLDAVGAGHARPGRGPLAGPAAAPGRPAGPDPAHPRHRPSRAGDGERGHGRGGAGQPPAPPPGGLAPAGPGPVADRHRGGRPVPDLGAAGPSRRPAGRRPGGRFYPAIGFTALTLIGFVLLLTPTGKLPSPGWRWWARAMVAAPILLLGVVTLAGGPLDPRYQALGGPFDLRGLGGILLAANQLALAVTTLAVVAAAGSLVGRFRRARGVERLQLRWVALAAALVVLGGVAVLVALAVGVRGATAPLGWAVGVSLAVLPVAIGAVILRYRLYDLDRIISRTLAYGLLTI